MYVYRNRIMAIGSKWSLCTLIKLESYHFILAQQSTSHKHNSPICIYTHTYIYIYKRIIQEKKKETENINGHFWKESKKRRRRKQIHMQTLNT